MDIMHLSMLSPRVGGGGACNPREIDIEDWYLGWDFEIFPMPGREFDRAAYFRCKKVPQGWEFDPKVLPKGGGIDIWL